VTSWAVGDYLTHRYNPELGIGRVAAVEGRTVLVHFPTADASLRLSATTDALVRIDSPDALPAHERTLFDRLAAGDLDDGKEWLIRLDVLRFLAIREAKGLGSFLGGRVRLFPHQLYVAERATRRSPVRWLLADEVGLGKTIEACLILNRLVNTAQIDRCLIVAPESLTVQWLGELWRKYHQDFTLLETRRLADVARDFGTDFNPFDVHRRAVIALETLVAEPRLTLQAAQAGIDLLVVDEAQRLRRPPGHPGEPAYRAIEPIAALGRHVLLLSATPLEDDAHGFMRLLQLLRPDEFSAFARPSSDAGEVTADEWLSSGAPLPPCTSATRRVDIGGLPPRVGIPIALDGAGTETLLAREDAARQLPSTNPVARRQKMNRIRRALSDIGADDPRAAWLAAHAPRWKAAGEKTLVFVSQRDTLEALRTALSHRAQLATGIFHEELSTARRDTEVARFREAEGPSLLISTEAGGEGRNFEFCRRLVLFDVPWRPSVVEQRIGRLDRIGRQIPVEVVYFVPPRGVGADVVRLLEHIGLFREPLAGFEPQLAQIEDAIEHVADDPHATLSNSQIEELLRAAFAARTRIQEAAYHQLHRDPYRADMAASILSRVPHDLDTLTERAVVNACLRLGFRAEHLRGRRTFAIEFGNEAIVDSLPGVPGGSEFVGTFDREEAVADESIDFFASGHALVEGVVAHYQDGRQGRVARLELAGGMERGLGIVAIYRDGADFEVIALDAAGRERLDWARAIRDGAGIREVGIRGSGAADAGDWGALVRRLARKLDSTRTPECVATLIVRPA
jgi:ATP-dependent helicase HepA